MSKTVVFIESFLNMSTPWNGRMMREEVGISGSHTAIIYLAEEIASWDNYNVYVLSHGVIDEDYKNVKYRLIENVNNIECDVAIITFNLEDIVTLASKLTFRGKRNIISVLGCDLCHTERIGHFNIENDLTVIHLTNNVREISKAKNVCAVHYPYDIIPNSLDIDDLCEPLAVKENAFVYFPCYERGFEISKAVASHFTDFVLYCNTYYNEFRGKMPLADNIKRISDSSSPKKMIYSYLAKSKYFVYPLINLDNHMIHYDTFGYVVIEALLHGVVVLTPRLKVFEELYGSAVCYVDCEDIVDPIVLNTWGHREHNLGIPMIERYIAKINELENDKGLYESFVKKGLELRDKFSKKTVGEAYKKLFARLEV